MEIGCNIGASEILAIQSKGRLNKKTKAPDSRSVTESGSRRYYIAQIVSRLAQCHGHRNFMGATLKQYWAKRDRPARVHFRGDVSPPIGRLKLARTLPLAVLLLVCAVSGLQAQNKRLLAYYPSRARHGDLPFSADTIPFNKLTHIDHAFLSLNAKNDGSLTIPPDLLEPELIKKAHAAGVKVMVSLGGDVAPFTAVSANAAARTALAKNIRDFVVANGYDGVDLDWEYPEGLEQRSDCTLLMLTIRKELPAPRYLLSMATSGDPTRAQEGSYDFEALSQILDFINVMTYDFHGPWTKHAGHNSALFQSPHDPGHNDGSLATSIDIYVNYFHVPPGMLNIGTGFYGYELTTANGLWDPCEKCDSTTFSRSYGTYIKPRIGGLGWKREFDADAQAPYLVRSSGSERGFITYDDAESTARKVEYVLGKRQLGGVFTWALGGHFGDYDGHSEDLLDAMFNTFKKYQPLPAQPENPTAAYFPTVSSK